MKKKKNNLSTILLVVVFIAGLSLLLYPSVANWYNNSLYKSEISDYTRVTSTTTRSVINDTFERAYSYNEELLKRGNYFGVLSEDELKEYHRQLNITGDESNSMIGYISIPKIKTSLPIFHGTDEMVLNSGVGHLEGTSLPVGGLGTHTVLSGHRGLPSVRLFTDLDKLVEGDIFTIEVLGKTLYYQVDQILIVLPENVDALKIYEDEDFCTLVTCTPYGVNSHRLLVRGTRIENVRSNVVVTADAIQIEKTTVALCIGVPVLAVIWLYYVLKPIDKKEKKYE